MKARLAITGILTMTACLLVAQVHAQESKSPQPGQAGKNVQGEMHAYLGIAVEPLQPALARQLPDLRGRGVLVAHVTKDSPAEKAGIKAYDILVNYDDHQLFSPEQLVKLVQHDKSGRNAVLVVISNGKERKVNVTLGEHRTVAIPQARQRMHRAAEDMPFMFVRPDETMWESFDSMTLTRLDKDRFKADISYKDDKGKIERRSFEGTRPEIQKAINKQKDLPAAEREQLLRALNLRPPFAEFSMPHFFRPHNGVLWDFEDLDQSLFNDSQDR